ncbi:MAG: carbohydrate ABC transporter permease [Clostridia bacterium]
MAIVGKRTWSQMLFDWFNTALMAFIIVIILYPVLNMLAISLSSDSAVLTSSVTFYPRGIDFDAYRQVFQNHVLFTAYGNTIFIAVISCVLSLVFTSFAAYPLAFADFDGKKVISFMIVFTMWFSGGMIPSFLVIRYLGLINSLWSLIFSSLIGAYHVVILRNFFESIPDSLIESAHLDGAHDFCVLFRIVWPLSKPALALIALWVVVGHWNDFFAPLLYLNDFHKYTLQLVLRDIVLNATGMELYGMNTAYTTVESSSYAAISEQTKNAVVFVSMIPMLMLYPFLQKYFVKGIMLGAVKG